MKVLRLALVGVIALCAASPAFAQRVEAQPSIKLQPGIRPLGDAPLLMPEAVEKLKLTAEQKEKYTKIEADYKDAAKSVQEAFRKNLAGGGVNKEAFEKLQADTKKTREDSLAKVEPLLTAEQKTVFAEVKLQQQPLPGGIRPVPPIAIGIGQIVPAITQQRLQLTDEQKKQIEAIQKEAEAKVMKVLTDEQKKQLESMKKGPTIIIRPMPGVQPPPIQPQIPNVRPVDPARKDEK
jgi:Spy/CpxP family protein refolding chaperone